MKHTKLPLDSSIEMPYQLDGQTWVNKDVNCNGKVLVQVRGETTTEVETLADEVVTRWNTHERLVEALTKIVGMDSYIDATVKDDYILNIVSEVRYDNA